jgi:SagB-type dehydrogenase family enzyme
MRRRDLEYAVIAAMFLSGVYVTISGLIAGLFGFPQFFLHRYAGYICTGLIAVHLILHWRRITAYLRRWSERRKRQERPEQPAVRPRERLWSGRRQLLISVLGAVGGFVLGWLVPDRRPVELPDEATDVGELYHRWSALSYSGSLAGLLSWGGRPEGVKTYADAERVGLPDPRSHKYRELVLREAIEARRSVRDYSSEPLSLEGLSHLLYVAQGITEERWGFRAAPSAGALYPIELYAAVHNVTGLERGLYHYAVPEHGLELLRYGDFRAAVVQAGLGQDFLGQANVCFILSAIFQRTRWRYRERTYRYVLLEAGHIGQNLYLAATSMGLGACAVGAFFDDQFDDLLGLDGEAEAVLYVISVGGV